MNRDHLYENRETAGRMEVMMYLVAGISILAGVLALLNYGLMLSLGFLILGALAFGLARVFDLLGELFVSQSKRVPTGTARAPEGTVTKT